MSGSRHPGRPGDREPVMKPPRRRPLWAAGFAALFALACDFWNWGDARLGWLALPRWLWYHFGLVLALFLLLLAALGSPRKTGDPGSKGREREASA